MSDKFALTVQAPRAPAGEARFRHGIRDVEVEGCWNRPTASRMANLHFQVAQGD
jgi:hypothetical protein